MLYLILAIVGGIALALGLAIFVLHNMGKSMSPDHVHVCSMSLKASPEAVFDVIADAQGWTAWDPGVKRVEPLPAVDGQPACRMFVGHNAMRLVTTRSERPSTLERTVRDDGKRLMFSGSWLHEITPEGGGCVVRLTERGTIHVPFARVMARKLADPAMYLKRHLTRLAAKFGEQPEIRATSN